MLVRGEREALVIEVVNGPPAGDVLLSGAGAGAGTGTGLTGQRERIDAAGGRLEAGPTADGGWRLSARLKRRTTRALSERG